LPRTVGCTLCGRLARIGVHPLFAAFNIFYSIAKSYSP
jgi:hypothetical protein